MLHIFCECERSFCIFHPLSPILYVWHLCSQVSRLTDCSLILLSSITFRLLRLFNIFLVCHLITSVCLQFIRLFWQVFSANSLNCCNFYCESAISVVFKWPVILGSSRQWCLSVVAWWRTLLQRMSHWGHTCWSNAVCKVCVKFSRFRCVQVLLIIKIVYSR